MNEQSSGNEGEESEVNKTRSRETKWVAAATMVQVKTVESWNKRGANKNEWIGTSLVVQWLRIHLLMQGHKFDPWSRKIPHAVEQLSPWAPSIEPVLQSPGMVTTEPPCYDQRSHRNEKPLITTTRESLRSNKDPAHTRTGAHTPLPQHSTKIILKKKLTIWSSFQNRVLYWGETTMEQNPN